MPETVSSLKSRLVAGVLAGGRSKRFGSPKALLRLNTAETLIEHAVRVAEEVAGTVVLLNPVFEIPAHLQMLPALRDEVPDSGPLGGLCALLDHCGSRWALLLACDMPLLSSELLARLLTQTSGDADAVVFTQMDNPGTFHSCCALYHPRLLPRARRKLHSRDYSLQNLLGAAHKNVIVTDPQMSRCLSNVNTPEDWKTLLHNPGKSISDCRLRTADPSDNLRK